MTNEYVPGTEDIYLSVGARPDGNVSLGIHLVKNNHKIYGVIINPEVARSAAYNLTLASWNAEEFKKRMSEGEGS